MNHRKSYSFILSFSAFIHVISAFLYPSFRYHTTTIDFNVPVRRCNGFKTTFQLDSTSAEDDSMDDDKILRQTALMVSLWKNVAFPPDTDNGVEFKLSDFGLTRSDIRGFLNHFQNCKDCAADNAFLMATQNSNNEDVLKLTSVNFPILSEDEDDEKWTDYENYYEKELDENGNEIVADSVFPIEDDDEIVLKDTKAWVRKMIADLGICPFTINPDKAGIPLGGVRYTVSRAIGIDEAFYRFWEEVASLLISSEKEMSTVLLTFPEIELFGNFELFESYCDALSDALCSSCMGVESQLQLVFFHPKYQFRDGKARLSSDEDAGAANFARRSPWPMINILRTKQVRAAQKGIPTGQVYQQNEEKLCSVGTSKLQKMLTTRNWDDLPCYSTPGKLLAAQQKAAAQNLANTENIQVFDSNNEEYDAGWPTEDSTLEPVSVGSAADYSAQTDYASELESDNSYVQGSGGELTSSEEFDAGWPVMSRSQSKRRSNAAGQRSEPELNTEEYDAGWPTEDNTLEPVSVGSAVEHSAQTDYASELESDNSYVQGSGGELTSSEEFDAGWPVMSRSQSKRPSQSAGQRSEPELNTEEYDAGWPTEDSTLEPVSVGSAAEHSAQTDYASELESDNSYVQGSGGELTSSEEFDAGWPVMSKSQSKRRSNAAGQRSEPSSLDGKKLDKK